jgi:hypothetical protein
MRRVRFQARGHENVIAKHRTTVEITTEAHLTREGTCIIGVQSDRALSEIPPEIKTLVRSEKTEIILRLKAANLTEIITGKGHPGLTYSDKVSMVARKSSFVCERTLMVSADKAASDLNRSFVDTLKDSGVLIECELLFITE